MVDGLTGGVFHRQQSVLGHPAAIEGLNLRVCAVHLRESLAQLQSQGATGGLVLRGTRGWRGGQQDSPARPAEWVHMAFNWISTAAAVADLRL